ncbi:MAG: PilZ domain-containing protein [Candidatus Eremiobacteraeota bacterium]|nr:PilZ domain-containing protein [Candidatus Eremiobacteraeota bacterium]
MSGLQVQGDLLTFCVPSQLRPGDCLRVSMKERTVQLEVESCRPIGDKEFLVTARAPVPLEGLVDSVPVLGTRRQARLDERLRVMSPELPDYQALTQDISAGGLRLDVSESLEPGELLALSISFPGYEREVDCEVQVLWCRPEGNRWVAGCRFTDPDEPRLRAGLHTLRAPALPGAQLPAPRRQARFAPLGLAG